MKTNLIYLVTAVIILFTSCAKENLVEPNLQAENKALLEKSSNDDIINRVLDDTHVEMNLGEELTKFERSESTARSGGYYSFRTLRAALQCTGLRSALFSGNKTIYAPSDAAFAKLGLNRHNVLQEIYQ